MGLSEKLCSHVYRIEPAKIDNNASSSAHLSLLVRCLDGPHWVYCFLDPITNNGGGSQSDSTKPNRSQRPSHTPFINYRYCRADVLIFLVMPDGTKEARPLHRTRKFSTWWLY